MTLTPWRRPFASLVALTVLAAVGCGGSSKEAPPPQAPASPAYGPAEESEKAKGAPGATDQSSGAGAPAPAQAPAAGSAFPGSTKGEGRSTEATDDIDVLGKKLEGALTLSAPDCTMAWSLRDRICDLADRICDLAGRSAERDIAERCTDGRARCERATSRVRETCGR